MQFSTLDEATSRYRLRAPTISNASIAFHLGLELGDGFSGDAPVSCFFMDAGHIVAVRMDLDTILVFKNNPNVQAKTEIVAIAEET